MLKICTLCKIEKSTTSFSWDKTNKTLIARCKLCRAKLSKEEYRDSDYRKRYSKTEAGKKAILKASNKARQNHPEKWEARGKLRYAVKLGVVKKPIHCEQCDEIKSLQGHHEDYTQPFDVMWLCTRCHADRHLELKILSTPQDR